MAAIVKIKKEAHKTCKISFNIHSSGHKRCLRQRRRDCQSGRGGLLIFMMIIDSIENLSLLLFLALFICPFEGIKYFMKSINIIFSRRRFFKSRILLRHKSKNCGRIFCSVKIIKVELWEFLLSFFMCLHNFAPYSAHTNRAAKAQ